MTEQGDSKLVTNQAWSWNQSAAGVFGVKREQFKLIEGQFCESLEILGRNTTPELPPLLAFTAAVLWTQLDDDAATREAI
ncbi:MAG: hypothetical protein KC561_19560, partial [Myxococcales bacterium]|nr:hypothetical protein [Myxococcales bacterium]